MLRKRTLNFGTWNTQSLSRKLMEVTSELKNQGIDVAVVTETKKKGEGSENLGHYDHFYSGVTKDKRAQQGISIFIRKNLRRYITSWEAINERLIKMNICLHGYKTTIIGVYGINEDALTQNKEEFFEHLNEEISKIGTSREIIIMGDMNSRVGKKDQDKIVGRYGEDTINDNGNRLINICNQNNLRIMNGFFQHRDIHKYTWSQHTKNLRSIIDYVITKQNKRIKIQDTRACRGATCGSDHHLVKAKILFPSRNVKTENIDSKDEIDTKPKGYNLDSLQHESTRILYQNRLDEKLKRNSFFGNTDELYNHIKESIQEAALEALGHNDINRRAKPYWWDPDIENDIEDKRQKYNKYLRTLKDVDKILYKAAQAKVRKKITQKKNESWDRKCTHLNTYIGGARSTESWRFIKSLRMNKKGNIISPIKIQQWEEHFKKLLVEDRKEFKAINNRQERIVTIGSPIRIDHKEVEEIL
jgi:hypothetical protein